MAATSRLARRTLLIGVAGSAASALLAACGGSPAAETPRAAVSTAAPAATTTGAATGAPAVAATAASGSVAASSPAVPAAGGAFVPTPGKPYNGTKLNYLICCPTAGQFAALAKRTPAEFTPQTGIEVTWDTGPYNAFQQKLLAEGVAGTGAYDNVAWVDSWGAGVKPYLLPLNDRLAKAGISMDDFAPAYVKASSSDDGKTVYGIPLRGHAQMLFYRKDVFDKAGVKPPATYQELVTVGQAIKEKGGGIQPMVVQYAANAGQNVFAWLSLLWGNGGDVFDANWKPVFNSPQGVEATQFYVDLLRTYNLTAPASTTWAEADAVTEFSQGRAAMFVGWSWIYSSFTNKANPPEVVNNVGFVPAPGWQGKPAVTYAQIWPTGILKSSKKQEAAFEYLRWLTSVPVEKEVALDKSDPKTDNIVVVHNTNLKDPEINKTTNGLQNEMLKVLQTARTEPLIPEWPQVESIIETAINDMASGKPVPATLDKAQKDVNDVLVKSGRLKS